MLLKREAVNQKLTLAPAPESIQALSLETPAGNEPGSGLFGPMAYGRMADRKRGEVVSAPSP